MLLNYIKTTLKQLIFSKKDDPIWNYEKWMQIEEKFGVCSTYFFFVRSKNMPISLYDCDFKLDDTFKVDGKWLSVKEYIVELKKRGHEIGLHGSFTSAKEENVFRDQKECLEKIIKEEIVATRQHYLHFISELTPKIHIQNGIKIDSTLGLNRSIGFRMGTSMPFLIEANGSYLWELPLLFMDSAILGHQKLDLETAKVELDQLIKKVESVGGCLTVNFHPDYVNEPSYFDLYEYLLKLGKERNAYFGTCKEIFKIVDSCVE